MARALLTFLLSLAAWQAGAGPWPRGPGEAYVFVGYEDGAEPWSSLYAEYGLPRGLTLGLDAGGKVNELVTGVPDAQAEARARAFLRVPVLSGEAAREGRPDWLSPWLAAVEIGLGPELDREGDTALRYSLGVTVGRPLRTPLGDGWTTLDLRLTAGGGPIRRLNAASVIGAKPTERLTVELGLFAEREERTSWTVAPTVQYGIGRFGAARLGLSLKDGGDTVLRLGWARAF